MSDDMDEHGCQRYSCELAELALGTLTGRARVETLAHVELCPRCADELEQLSRVADAVVQVAPESEPSVGFEVRVFERMGVATRPSRRRVWDSRWVPIAAAAAVVALGLGLGLTLTSAPSPPAAAVKVTSANLVENGVTVGHVDIGWTKSWMSIALADSSARGRVECMVITDDGVAHRVGSFNAWNGYGAWVAPLHVEPAAVRTAEVVSSTGTVVATATLG